MVLTWTKVSGPQNGVASFTNPTMASTTASFNRVGTYTLQLDANDGQNDASGTMTVTVRGDPRGDFDGLNGTDGSDFLIWQRNYNHGDVGTGAPIVDANFHDPNYAKTHGDANGDRKVDGTDFLIWQQDYVFCH